MLWEPSGCCCCSLRTGSLVLASIIIFFGAISCLNTIGALAVNDVSEILEEVCQEDPEPWETATECVEVVTPIFWGIVITNLVLDILSVIITSLLIHGIVKRKTTYMVPFMIMLTVAISIFILVALVICGFFLVHGVISLALVFAIVFFCIIFLYTYFLLVVRALFLQIRRNKGRAHLPLTEQGYSGVRLDGE